MSGFISRQGHKSKRRLVMCRARKYYSYSMFSRAKPADEGSILTSISQNLSICLQRARRPVVMGLLILGLTGGPLATVVKPGQGSPIAAVDQPTHDFGEVYEGEHISHTFTVRNTGSAPLELRDPAAKVQNAAAQQDGSVAAALTKERRIDDLAVPAAVSPSSFARRAGIGPAVRLLSAAGRRAAPS